jgi:hypothetical protein
MPDTKDDLVVRIAVWRGGWRSRWRRKWTLIVGNLGVTQSEANLEDAELTVREYVELYGFAVTQRKPKRILYQFDIPGLAPWEEL